MMLLSRDWSKTLGGYFSMYFTYLWLPWKGFSNQIQIDSEPRLTKMITNYGTTNEVAYFEVRLRVYKFNEIMTFTIAIVVDPLEGEKESKQLVRIKKFFAMMQ